MAGALHHNVIRGRDEKGSTSFLAETLGREAAIPFAHFMTPETTNGVSLDDDGHNMELLTAPFAR